MEIVSGQIAGRPIRRSADLGDLQCRLDNAGDTDRDLVLEVKNVIERTVEVVSPEMRTPSGLDQLCSNAHALAGLAHGAFQDVAYAQLPADLLHVYSPPFVSEARIAGDNEEPADARKRSDDLLDHSVAEIFLLGVAAHVLERQHGDRRLFGQCWQRLRQFLITRLARDGLFAEQDAIDAHRPRYVLDPLLAHVVERELDLVAHLVAYYTADADPARLGQGFETCGDVNAIPENVVTLDADATEIDADTERDTLIGGDADISPCHL